MSPLIGGFQKSNVGDLYLFSSKRYAVTVLLSTTSHFHLYACTTYTTLIKNIIKKHTISIMISNLKDFNSRIACMTYRNAFPQKQTKLSSSFFTIQSSCIHFEHSSFVHWTQFFVGNPSDPKSSAKSPKQIVHSLLVLSLFCGTYPSPARAGLGERLLAFSWWLCLLIFTPLFKLLPPLFSSVVQAPPSSSAFLIASIHAP